SALHHGPHRTNLRPLSRRKDRCANLCIVWQISLLYQGTEKAVHASTSPVGLRSARTVTLENQHLPFALSPSTSSGQAPRSGVEGLRTEFFSTLLAGQATLSPHWAVVVQFRAETEVGQGCFKERLNVSRILALDQSKSPGDIVRAGTPFIGRRQQLDWSERCLGEALAGRPRVV